MTALLAACSSDNDLTVTSQQDAPQTAENAVRFNTYIARTNITRGGAYGALNTDKLKDVGFGVFAYYTGATTYADYRTQNATAGHYPNFMYNEKIVGDGDSWKYADPRDTKYWPNDYNTGGQVSFFAYAPYSPEADYTNANGITGKDVDATDHDGTNSGVVAFSGNLFNGGKADAAASNERYKFSDPYLRFNIASDIQKQVDLLWATTTGSSPAIDSETLQMGSAANSFDDNDNNGNAITALRPAFNVATDLTKQKTTGTVDFLFKHALAKIGGSYIGNGDGSDEDGNTPTNGLLVILDIDKDGKELGGSLQPYAGTPLEEGSVAADNKYNTKVTINEIVLKSERQLNDTGVDALKNNTTFEYNDTYTADVFNSGIFNLVTGVWDDPHTTAVTSRTQTIVPTDVTTDPSTANADDAKDAVMNRNIAEPVAANWTNAHTKEAFEQLPIGVTTVAKNVFQSEVSPFVFIPGTCPIVEITVDYTVRTYDAKLANKYTEVRQRITKRLYILDVVQLNKQYNILIHLGLTSVKFTAKVDEWEKTDAHGTTTTGGEGGGESDVTTYEDEVEHIYLPINVE